jgi:hypothetical protein
MKTAIYERETTSTTTGRAPAGAGPGAAKPELNKEAILKAMAVAGRPGPAHKALGALTGSWKAEVKCWMDPDDPPNVSQATSTANWILEGRFLDEEFHGEMMGQPFTGRCLMGFDNTKQKFNSVWVDSLHTSMFTSEGKGDDANKVITLEGRMDCPATGQRNVPVKQLFHLISPEKHVLEMFNDGRKTMEITYTRP